MTTDSFRGKPSKSHIVWTRETRDGATRKNFDHGQFERWARHCGFDFEQSTRVDRDRGAEPRTQYRCVFTWGRMGDETMELGDEEWSLGAQPTPRTFIELDGDGRARVKGWTFETVVDVSEMRHDGPELLVETADGGRKRLDGRALATEPRERRQDGE